VSELDTEKLFYERFWSLHSNEDLVKVYARFGYKVFRRSSVMEWFGPFIAGHAFSGKRCVEIGTRYGLTAIVLSRHFDEVVSFDIEPNAEKYEIIEYLGLTNIRFVDVKNNAEKAAAINAMDFDGAYVDGDHIRDTRQDFDLVKKCGRVLFHEYWNAQPAVKTLVDELAAEGNVVTRAKWALWTRS
jgi:hypothetical protein